MVWRRHFVWARPALAITLALSLAPRAAVPQARLRSAVAAEAARAQSAFDAAPNDPVARRTLATLRFQLGDVWQAVDLIAPLATRAASDTADLALGARLALLTGRYPRAEQLYGRLRELAPPGSVTSKQATEGLAMVYYQTNQYARAGALELSEEGDGQRGLGSLLSFMKRFEGEPYTIEWPAGERRTELPITNDFVPGGALPEVDLEINGQRVHFILDTGGDRLYLDEGVAERLGLTVLAKRRTRYAYTGGQYVEEPLAVADRVRLGEVTVRRVPVIVAKWKALGQTTDGVLTTQMLKQFLSTVDYQGKRIVLRERSPASLEAVRASLGASPVELPFFMTGTHLMFAKGEIDGHDDLNLLLDSGLAASVPMVILDETVEDLGLTKTALPNSKYYLVSLESHGLAGLGRGAAQALGNVIVEENAYWSNGFLWDGLISHQYLRHFGSWTIDFDAMRYYFPAPKP